MMKIKEFAHTCVVNSPEFHAGVEYEVEAIQNPMDMQDNPYLFKIEKDGSLRNGGLEFITKPLNYDNSLKAFKSIHDKLKLKMDKDPFSERTSIHVHVNCGDLTFEQTKLLVLCYVMLEPMFFGMVNPKRKHNIHCVPLTYTALPLKYRHHIGDLVKYWSKYTAFNILPLAKQATVEFRHLQGTNDFELFKTWLTKIKDLYDFVYENPDFQLGAFLSEGRNANDLHKIIYQTPLSVPLEQFTACTIDVKESFV